MQKLLNDPRDYADEALEGLCLAHSNIYRRIGETGRVIARAHKTRDGKVGVVSGGGSGQTRAGDLEARATFQFF